MEDSQTDQEGSCGRFAWVWLASSKGKSPVVMELPYSRRSVMEIVTTRACEPKVVAVQFFDSGGRNPSPMYYPLPITVCSMAWYAQKYGQLKAEKVWDRLKLKPNQRVVLAGDQCFVAQHDDVCGFPSFVFPQWVTYGFVDEQDRESTEFPAPLTRPWFQTTEPLVEASLSPTGDDFLG